MTTYTVPYPPSANRFWRNYHGQVVKSHTAKAFAEEVGWLMRKAGVMPIEGDVALYVTVYSPTRRRDLDNCAKALCDALQGHVYDNDNQIVELHMWRIVDKHKPRVEFRVEKL